MTIPLIQVLAAIMITVITITIIESEEEEKKNHFFFASIFFSWQEMCLSQSSIFPVCFIPTISCSSKSIIAIATKRKSNCLFCTNVNKTRIVKNYPWCSKYLSLSSCRNIAIDNSKINLNVLPEQGSG